MKVPKRCLSVHLCNIHQQWILMSNLTEKENESTLFWNGGRESPQRCQIICAEPRLCWCSMWQCEQTLTWMSVCQSEARRKSLPLCSCVQLSPRKKWHLPDSPRIQKVPRETGLRWDWNTKHKWKRWGITSINRLKVKDLLKGRVV